MTSAEVVGSRPPRRARARLLVPLDGSCAGHAELVRALRDARRRDAVVLACVVVDDRADDVEREIARAGLDAQVARAVAETGVPGRVETALLEPAVFEALTGATRGGALVVVQEDRRTVLRPAAPPAPARPIARLF